MPRNFSELKSGGGTIPMLSPHPEKWGGGDACPRPPPIDASVREGRNDKSLPLPLAWELGTCSLAVGSD